MKRPSFILQTAHFIRVSSYNFKRLVLGHLRSYSPGTWWKMTASMCSIFLWGVLGVKNAKKHSKIIKSLLLKFSFSISKPLYSPFGPSRRSTLLIRTFSTGASEF